MPPDAQTGEVLVDLKPEQMDLLADTVLKQDELGFDVETKDKPERARDDSGRFAKKDDGDSELAKLREQLREADEERTRLRTESATLARERAELASKVHQASHGVQESEYARVQERIANAEARLATLKKEKAVANTLADYETVSDIDVEIAKLINKQAQDQHYKQRLEARYHESKRQQTQQPEDPRVTFEKAIAGVQSEASKAWLRAHPECVNNSEKVEEVRVYHRQAVKSGLAPDSPQYFQYIEEQMGYRQRGDGNKAGYDDPPQRKQYQDEARTMSPPVHRDGNSNSGNPRPNQMKLSAEEVEMARLGGMTNEEYAIFKLQAHKDGRNYDAKFRGRGR